MSYWDDLTATASNLRLFDTGVGWRQYDDVKDEDGKVTSFGSSRAIELALSTALNSSNLLLLSGAGTSFCAKNPTGRLAAPSMSDLWDAVEASATPTVMSEIIGLIPNADRNNKNIEKLLTLCKLYTALFNDEQSVRISAFIQTAERAILARVDFVEEGTDISSHRTLVRKIARRGLRKPRAKIFTTNYDLCFEWAARQQQFVVVDGFSHSTPQVYDRAHFSYDIVRRDGEKEAPDYIENVFHLYKLHGSLDWRRKDATIFRSRDATSGDPVLIYPRDSKYQESFAPPFLDMMGALQTGLREPDTTLIISGFGFNDDHISKPIMAAVEANMSLRVIICDVAFLADDALCDSPQIVPHTASMRMHNSYIDQFLRLAKLGDKRIILVNGRFEDLSMAVPDLVAETDRERHIDRLQRLHTLMPEQVQ